MNNSIVKKGKPGDPYVKRMCGLILALCMVICLSAALAETWTCETCGKTGNEGNFCADCGSARPAGTWICANCGKADNEGKFCANCGAAKGEEALRETGPGLVSGWKSSQEAGLNGDELNGDELNGDELTGYYLNAVKGAVFTPYLTNIMRWRDGVEETSGLAVPVYDLDTGGLRIWASSDILSEGCDYLWQGRRESYPVEPDASRDACGLVSFKFGEGDEKAVIDEIDLFYAACPAFGFGESEGSLKIVYFGFDEARKRLVAREQWAKVVGYEDHGAYQTVSLADYEGYADAYYEYEKDLEAAAPWWRSGIDGVLVNMDGSICGVHVAGVGMVSLLPLNDENFYRGANSGEESIPDPAEVFGVALLRTEELDGFTGRVYELPEGYESNQAIYAKYMARLLSEGFPLSAGYSEEGDGVCVFDTYEFKEETLKAILFSIQDDSLVFFERTGEDAELAPWDWLESMGWDMETYRYSTY